MRRLMNILDINDFWRPNPKYSLGRQVGPSQAPMIDNPRLHTEVYMWVHTHFSLGTSTVHCLFHGIHDETNAIVGFIHMEADRRFGFTTDASIIPQGVRSPSEVKLR